MAGMPIVLPPGLQKQRGLGPDWGAWLDRLPAVVGDLLPEWELTPRRRRALARLLLAGGPGPHRRRRAGRAQGRASTATTSPSTRRSPSSTGTATAPSGCCAPTRAAGRCCSSGSTARPDGGVGPRGVRDRRRPLPAAPPARAPAAAHRHVVRRAVAGRARPAARATRRSRAGWSSRRCRSVATWSPTRPASAGSSTATSTTRTCWPPSSAEPAGPWLVIDPKPMSGDPHYEPAPMLWNRFDEYAGDVRDGVRRRFHTLVDAAGLDEDRARDWVVVRMVINANWAVEDAAARRPAARRRGTGVDHPVHRDHQGRPGLTRVPAAAFDVPAPGAGILGRTPRGGACGWPSTPW